MFLSATLELTVRVYQPGALMLRAIYVTLKPIYVTPKTNCLSLVLEVP
jgi:hypothetical protein